MSDNAEDASVFILREHTKSRIIQESRDYRVMHGWLMAQYPDILATFVAFKENLQRQNPWRKDLSTSPTFRRFVLEKTGTYYILLSFS